MGARSVRVKKDYFFKRSYNYYLGKATCLSLFDFFVTSPPCELPALYLSPPCELPPLYFLDCLSMKGSIITVCIDIQWFIGHALYWGIWMTNQDKFRGLIMYTLLFLGETYLAIDSETMQPLEELLHTTIEQWYSAFAGGKF